MAFSCLRFTLTFCLVAFAAAQRSASFAQQIKDKQPARDGIYSFVEFNPADLLWGRYRIAQESLILESFSFAWNGEVQENRQKGKYTEQSFTTGMGLQYYPQSVTLQGGFIRAETSLALSGVSDQRQSKFHLAAVKVAGDLGWRVRLSEKLTGSAAYGVRTTLPHVIWSNNDSQSKTWMQEGDSPDVRVQINLGLLL
jgi:hypothetical protein